MSSIIPGTNIAPISFPGIASGIDYNAIIQKLTSLQLSQNTIYNTKITGLASANAELVKINSLFLSVQNSLTAISQPSFFNASSATVSNPSVLTAAGNPKVAAIPGTYTITATQLATASQVTGTQNYGHSEFDSLGGNPADTIVFSSSYTQITPNNGDPSKGQAVVTIDGVRVSYDVNGESFDNILANINAAVQAVDPGFLATVAPGTDTVVFESSDAPITLGSATDNGNLLQVFKLDQAQLVNSANSGLITASGGVGGVNQSLTLNSQNAFGATTDANYVTPVTSGTFTINGVTISVDNTKDALVDVLRRINASGAGVNAAFDPETGRITLTNASTGPQSIVVGSAGDTSNFLSASGLTGAGVTTTIGRQASVTLQNAGGGTSTIYSNSNTVTTAIPGISLTLMQATASPFTVTVASDTTGLVSAINTFISAYNAAITEINTATAAPTVIAAPPGTANGRTQVVGGGVLYNNNSVTSLKDSLTSIIAGLYTTTGYNSLQAIGLQVSSSFTTLTADANNSSAAGPITSKTLGGTDGTLQPLDVAKFQAAFAANPSQVQALFTGQQGPITTLGAYLTGVSGQPTTLFSGLAGNIPNVSLIQGFENTNSDQITSLQQQVKLVTDSANQYADSLRKQFFASEKQIAQLQALQSQLASFFKGTG